MAVFAVVDPAMAMAMAMANDVRAANHAADDAADDRAGRSGNDGAGTGTDGDAFKRSGLSHDRRGHQHQC
jgi:hypothetical protein